MSAVSTRDLCKSYDEIEALRGVTLDVEEGETFGILGPNGAGKTTLQQILCTLTTATSGEATVDGHSVSADPGAVRSSLGVVFQVPTLDPAMSARENLVIHGQIYRVPKAQIAERIPDLLALAQLADREHDEIRTFSGGMKRRLEIVRSLLHRPRILLLDEPTIGLDPQSRRLIWERMGVMKKDYGVTVLLTTHYMDEADQLCDRLAIIDHGEIIALDKPSVLKHKLGGDRLELRLAELPAATLDGILDRMRRVPNVLGAEAPDGVVTIRFREPGSTIPEILREVGAGGGRVLDMNHSALSMDDVFLDYTGRVRDKGKKRRKARSWRGLLDSITGGGA